MKKNPNWLRLILAFILAGMIPHTLASDPVLTKNPFKRPALTPTLTTSISGTNSEGAGGFVLRGTLVAGKSSMANVSGKIIYVGESVDGYRLLSIEEGKVVLVKNNKNITLRMEDKPVGEQ